VLQISTTDNYNSAPYLFLYPGSADKEQLSTFAVVYLPLGPSAQSRISLPSFMAAFFDSQATLVPQDGVTLSFSRDVPTNTVLSASDDLGYVVETKTTGRNATTTYSRKNGEVVAALEWHDAFSDQITIGNEPKTRLSKRFRKPNLLSSSFIFQGTDGKDYKWKGIGCGVQAQLFINGEAEVISTFDRSQGFPLRPATLRIEPRGVPMMDLIVVSFLALEKNGRVKEKSSDALALSVIGQARGIWALY